MDDNSQRNLRHERSALDRAALLHDAGRFEGAIQELRAYLALYPDDSEAHVMLSLCCSQTDDHSKLAQDGGVSDAMSFALSGIALDPENPQAHYAHGIAASLMGDINAAESAILEAVRLAPEDLVCCNCLARIYLDVERYSDALEWSDRALTLNPADAGCMSTRAMALLRLGRISEATDSVRRALAIDPEYADNHATLGWIALESGQPLAAARYFRSAIRLNPNHFWALDGYNQAARANPRLFQLVGSLAALLMRLPNWFPVLIFVGGWFAVHALPRLTASHPRLTLEVRIGLAIYFAVNLAVRIVLALVVAMPTEVSNAKSSRGFRAKLPSQLEFCYFLSLGCLPFSILWWPGLLISDIADFLALWAFFAYGADDTEKNGAVGFIGACVLIVVLIWLRGQ